MPKDYKLIVAGRVFNEAYLNRLKKIAGDKNVEFIENPKDEQLIELYQNASCFVLPSTHKSYTGKKHKKTELFGLVVVEAMACGTPVIVSSAASLPELVESGVNGYVFKDGDTDDLTKKIKKIIFDKKLILAMGYQGRKLVEEKYNWKKVAENVRDFYSKAVG
jgi:glycosyltransferase involved in cell wall biosynthesis